jgi:hypothetical protein
MPSAMESGGLLMTRSVAFNPASTSTVLPKSRPRVTDCNFTLLSVADQGDLHSLRAKNQRVVRKRQHVGDGGFVETHLRVAAGENFARGLGTCNSTCNVREAGSTAPAVRVTVASKIRPGSS